ncbi:MAG: hypothetical protein RL115_2047 [Bacteroidota bacterium]
MQTAVYFICTFILYTSIMSIINITTIQTDLVWENKTANLQLLEEKINAIQSKTEIIILPEMFSTGFSMQPQLLAETMDGITMQWMQRISATKKVILTGSLIIKENNQYYNRLVWMLPNGTFGMYDKRHLFAFAQEDVHYSPGTKRLIASVNGWRINLQICYDLRFPVWARQQSQADGPEYDLLIYVANWPEKRNQIWKTLLQARAIENQCYVIGVNRVGNDGNQIFHSGDSMIINPLGEIMYQQSDVEDVHTMQFNKATLNSIRTQYPFWKDADSFILTNEV